MKLFVPLLILLVIAPWVVFAEVRSNHQLFFNRLNSRLDTLGDVSNLKIAYDEATLMNAPMVGDYYLLEDVSVAAQAAAVRFTLTARSIAILPQDRTGFRLDLPKRFSLVVENAEGQAQHYQATVFGMPRIELKSDITRNMTHYRMNVPENIRIDLTQKESGRAATLYLHNPSQQMTRWQHIPAIADTKVVAFFRSILQRYASAIQK